MRVSDATESSKKAGWLKKSACEKRQNVAASPPVRRSTARAVSWTRVEDGCQGWICWRRRSWTLGASEGEARMCGITVVVRVWKSSRRGG